MWRGTGLCNNVEKAFKSKEQPRSSPKNHSAQPECLQWTPHLSTSRSGNYIFFHSELSGQTLHPHVQSRPTVCVWNVLKTGGKGDTRLRHMSHLQRPKTNSPEVRGAPSFQGGQEPPWARPRRADTPQHTSSSLSWQRLRAARGRLSDKPRSRVERRGWDPVEHGLHHYHFHHWKCLSYRMCNPEYSKACLSSGCLGRKCAKQMKPSLIVWRKWRCTSVKVVQILTADVN